MAVNQVNLLCPLTEAAASVEMAKETEEDPSKCTKNLPEEVEMRAVIRIDSVRLA